MTSHPRSSQGVTSESSIGPVTMKDRIEQLDVLRGVAVLGIFVMNVQAFAMISALYVDPNMMGEIEGASYTTWYVAQILCNTKFMSIFTVLFGAGMALMAMKAKSTGRSVTGVQYRRLFWLLIIGLLHAYLLFHGDVLVSYALLGAIAWLLIGLPTPALLSIAAVCLGLWFLEIISLMEFLASKNADKAGDLPSSPWQLSPEEIEQEISLLTGSFADQLRWRIPAALDLQIWVGLVFTGLRTFALMLIGAVLLRWSLLRGRHISAEWAMFIGGLVVGLPLVAWSLMTEPASPLEYGLVECVISIGNLAITAAWIGAILLLCRVELLDWLRRLLAPVGRMALTAYVFESVAAGWIFYGHGLGWFDQLNRVEQLWVVLVIWFILIVGSSLWLSWFRFGPLEWIWRMLTYWRFEQIRRGDPSRSG